MIIKADDVRENTETRNHNRALTSQRVGTYEDECYLCGRGLTPKGLASAWWVHVVNSGKSLTPTSTPEGDVGDMGWFPVGSACATRVPRSHRMRFTT